MWCDRCRRDSSTKIIAETGQSVCAICGADLDEERRSATDKARAFLDRWSSERPAKSPLPPADQANEESSLVSAHRESEPETQFPKPEAPSISAPVTSAPASDSDAPSASEKGESDMSASRPFSASRKENRGPASDWPDPAVQITSSHWSSAKPRRRNSIGQIFGQILAYAGILALTGGCALVIWGYFGGPEGYAPTGWLIATGGQMMLMLGITTLVSEGLEQSALEVRTQVKILDQRLERIERNAARSAIESRIRSAPARAATRPPREAAVA